MYLEGKFGEPSEIDVYVGERRDRVTGAEPQTPAPQGTLSFVISEHQLNSREGRRATLHAAVVLGDSHLVSMWSIDSIRGLLSFLCVVVTATLQVTSNTISPVLNSDLALGAVYTLCKLVFPMVSPGVRKLSSGLAIA